ncbi:hypothetical protein D3C71_2159140 [compost metagenome]
MFSVGGVEFGGSGCRESELLGSRVMWSVSFFSEIISCESLFIALVVIFLMLAWYVSSQ